MPTVAQLKNEIEQTLGYTISSEKIISIFNECLKEDLVGVLRIEASATTQLTETKAVRLPNDLFQLIVVKYDKNILNKIPLDDYENKGYTLFGNVIEVINIKIPGTIRIYYYKYPSLITKVDDVPDIPSEYHHALKYYFIAKYHQEDEEPELEKSYWEDYLKIKAQINIYTLKQKGLYRTRKTRVGLYL